MGDRAELIARPLEVYLAQPGTAFPALDEDPGSDWELLGKINPDNIGEDGVTVALPQSIEEFYGSSTMMVEAFRTEEGVTITVPVADMRLEVWKWAIGNDDEESSEGRAIDLERGPNTRKLALLARGQSPYSRDLKAQFELPRCFHSGEPEAGFAKGTPAELELEFTLLKPNPGTRARLVAQEPNGNGVEG